MNDVDALVIAEPSQDRIIYAQKALWTFVSLPW